MDPRIPLGQLLLEAGTLTEHQLNEALERQKSDGRRLGILLVEAGFIDEITLTQTLSKQLNAPWVSLYHVDFSRHLLNLIPRGIAERYCLIPVYVRSSRRHGNTLYVAMNDPLNHEAMQACAASSQLPVRAMVAPPTDIRNAIRVYYGGNATLPDGTHAPTALTEPSTESDFPPSMAPGALPPNIPGPPPLPPPLVARTKAAAKASEEAPVIEVKTIPPLDDLPHASTRMIQVTLLDGTVMSLPAPKSRRRYDDDDDLPLSSSGWHHDTQLTARDLVAALRAVAHGADASEVLGSNVKWEGMFAALLSLLLRKRLVADWEFIEEFKRI